MSINFNAYGFKSNDMNIADLEVGQTLIRVIRPRHYDSYEEVRTVEYTITKVLKTRVVVEPTDNPEGKGELRLLTDQSKWSFRLGQVKTDVEGSTQGYSRPAYEFATTDEQELIDQIIAHRAAQVAEKKVRNEAAATVRQIASTMHPTIESIDETIAALQALRAQMSA